MAGACCRDDAACRRAIAFAADTDDAAHDFLAGRSLSQVEAQIFEVILDMIPSAETIEPLHSRARIARAVLNVLHERL
jgi:hypothetical protein